MHSRINVCALVILAIVVCACSANAEEEMDPTTSVQGRTGPGLIQ